MYPNLSSFPIQGHQEIDVRILVEVPLCHGAKKNEVLYLRKLTGHFLETMNGFLTLSKDLGSQSLHLFAW